MIKLIHSLSKLKILAITLSVNNKLLIIMLCFKCMSPETAKKLLEENKRIYNEVARDYARTREGKWQRLLPLAEYTEDGDKVLDAGCGNGQVFHIFKDKDVDYFGIDTSVEMIKLCRERFKDFPRAQFEVGDLLNINFPDNSFNAVYCIASMHHIPSNELRIRTISELYRVLKPEGKLIISNWYYWTWPAIVIILKNWVKKIMGEDIDFGDIFVPWGKQGLRYYHSFRKNELKNLLIRTNFKKIKQHLERRQGDVWGKMINLITIAGK